MKIHKRLAALLLALTLCFGFTATAYAHEVPDMNLTGSISAKMLYDGQPVGGGSLVLYRVGDILESDGNYSFTLTDSFKGSGASLTNISDPALAKSLADYAKTNNLSGGNRGGRHGACPEPEPGPVSAGTGQGGGRL